MNIPEQLRNANDPLWNEREPWVVLDPDYLREWLVPQPLRFFLVQDQNSGLWSVCERWGDLQVPDTESQNRAVTIRRFYRWCGRKVPEGTTIKPPLPGAQHRV